MKASHITLITMFALAAAYVLRAPPFYVAEKVSEPPPAPTKITAMIKKMEAEKRAATRAIQLRNLLQEPDWDIQAELYIGFLYSLEPDEFAGAFAALTKQLKRQRSRRHIRLIEMWSERDPDGALDALRPMFLYVAPDQFTRSWEEKLLPPEMPEQLAGSEFWPTVEFLESFVDGLHRAGIPDSEKAELEARFRALYQKHLKTEPPSLADLPPRGGGKDYAEGFRLALQIRDADASELDRLLKQASEGGHSAAYSFVLRRIVQADPTRAPEALDMAAKEVETNLHTIYPGAGSQFLHAAAHHLSDTMCDDVFNEWVKLQPDVAVEWAEENSWDSAALANHLSETQRGESAPYYVFMARDDPSAALQAALDAGGEKLFGQVAEEVFTESRDFAQVGRILADFPAQLSGYHAGGIIDKWILWDTAGGTRFGADWLLNAGDDYPKERILNAWSGETDPANSTIEELVFGGLRGWALTQPKIMQSWIDTQQDPEVRETLQWLLDHPNGK